MVHIHNGKWATKGVKWAQYGITTIDMVALILNEHGKKYEILNIRLFRQHRTHNVHIITNNYFVDLFRTPHITPNR